MCTPKKTLKIKSELLCKGIKIETDIRKKLLKLNNFILEKDFNHAAHIFIDDYLVNTFFSENFCNTSDYKLKEENNNFFLIKNEKKENCKVEILQSPSWCYEYVDEIMIGKILRPHSKTCISTWPITKCIFSDENTKCKFCSLKPYSTISDIPDIIKVETLSKMIIKALKFKDDYQINLGGGTFKNPDWTIKYFIEILEKSNITKKNKISVEIIPPSSTKLLINLFNAGVTSIIMNLEIYDEQLRKHFCPGKYKFKREHYYKMLEKSVEIFGIGNVSSVLIYGIQSEFDILTASEKLCSLGIIPTIIPFKPFDNCSLNKSKIKCNKISLYELNKRILLILEKYNLKINKSNACISCGGCSLENTKKSY